MSHFFVGSVVCVSSQNLGSGAERRRVWWVLDRNPKLEAKKTEKKKKRRREREREERSDWDRGKWNFLRFWGWILRNDEMGMGLGAVMVSVNGKQLWSWRVGCGVMLFVLGLVSLFTGHIASHLEYWYSHHPFVVNRSSLYSKLVSLFILFTYNCF